MTVARSFLGNDEVGVALRINPYTAEWSYKHTMASQDTLGGRVVQLLSVNIDALTVTSVAGSRRELQEISAGIRDVMQFHIDSLRPVHFKVPSRNWDFLVYVEAMPQVGWDFAATSYPYTLQLRIVEDISGAKSNQIRTKDLNEIAAITRLNEGIGYIPGVHGGNADRFVSITSKLALNLVNQGTVGDTTSGDGGQNSAPGIGVWADAPWGNNLARGAPWQGATLREAVYNAWKWAGGVAVAERVMCIVQRESGWNPRAINKGNTNGSWDLGLMQINTGYAGGLPSSGWPVCSFHTSGCPHASWWPSDYETLFIPEYNVRAGIAIANGKNLGAWSTTQGTNGC